MWEIANQTPYGSESSWIRDKTGLHLWLVAVKATFDIAPDGTLMLAEQQPPPLLAAEHWGEPGSSSLRYDADVVPPKPTTDVVVNGSAYAPRGRPTKKITASLRVADVHKTVIVYGPRVYYISGWRSLKVSEAQPLSRIPSAMKTRSAELTWPILIHADSATMRATLRARASRRIQRVSSTRPRTASSTRAVASSKVLLASGPSTPPGHRVANGQAPMTTRGPSARSLLCRTTSATCTT